MSVVCEMQVGELPQQIKDATEFPAEKNDPNAENTCVDRRYRFKHMRENNSVEAEYVSSELVSLAIFFLFFCYSYVKKRKS